MSGWHCSIGLISLISWLLFLSAVNLPASLEKVGKFCLSRYLDYIQIPSLCLGKKDCSQIRCGLTMEALVANLPDGIYQFCTVPDPQDWRDGAGACLNFVKQGTTVDGYYGYPHSDRFVCLRGQISEDWLQGEGLVISWAGHAWSDIPQAEFSWDEEGRLYLSQGELVHSEKLDEGQISWIIFQQARLNMQGLYPYPESRMTSPTQLCNWLSN